MTTTTYARMTPPMAASMPIPFLLRSSGRPANVGALLVKRLVQRAQGIKCMMSTRGQIAADVGIAPEEMIHSSREGDDRANELCSSSTICCRGHPFRGEFLNSPRFRAFPQRSRRPSGRWRGDRVWTVLARPCQSLARLLTIPGRPANCDHPNPLILQRSASGLGACSFTVPQGGRRWTLSSGGWACSSRQASSSPCCGGCSISKSFSTLRIVQVFRNGGSVFSVARSQPPRPGCL
jgi:hypothetical protein